MKFVAIARANAIDSCALALLLAFSIPAFAAGSSPAAVDVAWWVWSLRLFCVCFLLGIVAVPAGVGGGVLFVPIIGAFFPFHLDFVRGAGLLVALASALSAGPNLLRCGLANVRLALPLALLASISSVAGALIGFALPPAIVETALGVTILLVVALMARATTVAGPSAGEPDALSGAMHLYGVFHDPVTHQDVEWRVRNTLAGLLLFAGIGVLAGMFGMGAGWANVPALNIVMGVPLKVSAGTSSFILSLVDSAAAWVYLHKGAVLAVVAVPSMIGMMLGARIGAKLLTVLRASLIRKLVLGLLLFSGIRALMKGFGI